MEHKVYRSYNMKANRPNVLLLGNGILRSCSPNQSTNWEEGIKKLSDFPDIQERYQKLSCAPYTVQATAFAPFEDSARQHRYLDVFQTLQLDDDLLLKELLELPFDTILTTNYTYEIENIYYDRYSDLKDKRKYACCTKQKRDYKRLIHTYNKLGQSPEIWHIHGELRVPSSIILTHDEYVKLIGDIVLYNKYNRDRYQYHQESLKFYSWIDYLIMGNVFVLGQGVDFSEFDLWWLLNRKKREKAEFGTVHVFTPNDFRCKSPTVRSALDQMGFSVSDCGITLSMASDISQQYSAFYRNAITEIREILDSNKKQGEQP